MKDDIETLRKFIGLRDESAGNYPDECAVEALAALERAATDRDSLRKALDDRFAADLRAAKAIFAETGRTSGFPGVKEVVAYYMAEVERLEKERDTTLVACWLDGPPPKPYSEEWFIAVTTYGDRVVLKALPEEYAYDFKTADETYIKADKIAKWMQFPDSNYNSSANALIATLEKERAEALTYATSLLVAFVNRYCSPVPEWKPLPELVGVLTQLDNATTVVREAMVEAEKAFGSLFSTFQQFMHKRDWPSDTWPRVQKTNEDARSTLTKLRDAIK